MAIIGTHQIGYFKPKDSKIEKTNFKSKINLLDLENVYIKKFGHDKWVLNLGKILLEIINEIKFESSSNQNIINLKKINVESFKKGLFQWSEHSITIRLEYELLNPQSQLEKKGSVIGQGNGCAKEVGALTYVPIAGNINFDKGIELAIYRCYEDCLLKLYKEIGN